MKKWCYKWLPILYGCHCRNDRSLHWRGENFPICARCTGILVGNLLFAATAWFWMPSFWWSALMLIPLILDGSIQLKTTYESNNRRRALTGFLFGYGLLSAQVQSMVWSYWFGHSLTH